MTMSRFVLEFPKRSEYYFNSLTDGYLNLNLYFPISWYNEVKK